MIKLPIKVTKLLDYFQTKKFECYVVGGYLRDQLLGLERKNSALDFTTNATPEEMLVILPEGKYENRFGTVIFEVADIAKKLNLDKDDYVEKEIFEITTFRADKNYTDGRHPDRVEWSKTLSEDLKRRDFTINTLVHDGRKLIDLLGARADLDKKLVRAVGNANLRFEEDGLRMMRAVRQACELNFEIEENTFLAICTNAETLKKISMERIRDEFLRILKSDRAAEGVMLLKKSGLLHIFLPELVSAFGVGQKSPQRHHIYDVGTHLIKTLEACKNADSIVRLASLLHDIGKPVVRNIDQTGVVTFYNHEVVGTEMAYQIGRRLKLSNKDLVKLTRLVRYHQFSVSAKQTDKAVRRFIRELGIEYVMDILDLRTADRLGSGARETSWRTDLFKERLVEVQKEPFTVRDLKIGGQEVMKILNIKSGPMVGKVLDQLFELVENHKLNNEKDILEQEVKKLEF